MPAWKIVASGEKGEVIREVHAAKHPEEDRATADAIQFEKCRAAILDELDDYPEACRVSVDCTGHTPADGFGGYKSLTISISGMVR